MLKSLLTFDQMITPKLITVLYWLGLIGVLFSGIATIFVSNAYDGGFFSGLISGLATIIFGGLGVRISCELIILSFNIYGKLKKIAENTKPQ
ncbi:hypothetical protein B2H99_14110 [Morganella morganii]|uniref:DUF4282 domain-containing protein n=1 Tax=Morganella morganii TaxID=582 RepID=UPI0009BD19B1|nr:DUF4282 domain-containing protein [Morganella morganii]MBT0416347.1 DUF4282 domain-containing protein [Morganella morganii subsp. morganii]OQP25857.1 hypothetical protein B2H99_14110 [Morganella morganii]OQP28678.1 hypothetical protein B2I00_14175 [Morganella morganii]OVF51541.1 hypothetical protein B5724_17270 [Morganella morganii]HCT5879966.1 DUF4282 domain-containing protein [Morganella morganii]